MRHLGHHAANCRGVRTLDHLIQTCETEATHYSLVGHGRADCRAHPLQANVAAACIFLVCRHKSALSSWLLALSSSPIERASAKISLFALQLLRCLAP